MQKNIFSGIHDNATGGNIKIRRYLLQEFISKLIITYISVITRTIVEYKL